MYSYGLSFYSPIAVLRSVLEGVRQHLLFSVLRFILLGGHALLLHAWACVGAMCVRGRGGRMDGTLFFFFFSTAAFILLAATLHERHDSLHISAELICKQHSALSSRRVGTSAVVSVGPVFWRRGAGEQSFGKFPHRLGHDIDRTKRAVCKSAGRYDIHSSALTGGPGGGGGGSSIAALNALSCCGHARGYLNRWLV